MMSNWTGVELVLMTSPEGDHAASGLAEIGVREIEAQTSILEQRLGNRTDETDPLTSWSPRHAANCVSRYRLMDDGRTLCQRRCGKTGKRPVVEFGESLLSDQLVRIMQCEAETKGCCVVSTRDIGCHNLRHATWCETENQNRNNVGAREMGSRVQCNMHRSSVATEPDQRKLARPVVLVAKADQDVGLVIVVHAVPKIDWGRYVTKRDLVKYGYTDECQACTQLASGMHNAKVLTTTDAEIALASSWQVTTTRDKLSECRQEPSQSVDIPRPEAGEERW